MINYFSMDNHLTYKSYSDEELLEFLKMSKGVDELEWDRTSAELHRRFHEYVFYVCWKYLGKTQSTKDLAKDLCVEVFHRILKSIDTFSKDKLNHAAKKPVHSWIGVIATNMVKDFLESKGRKEVTTDFSDPANPLVVYLADEPDCFITSDERRALGNAFKALLEKGEATGKAKDKEKIERDLDLIRHYYLLKPIEENARAQKGVYDLLAQQFDTTPQYIKKLIQSIQKTLFPLAKEEFAKLKAIK
jgi:DNA-directed RNA polymerase specialized sigma24 family protein